MNNSRKAGCFRGRRWLLLAIGQFLTLGSMTLGQDLAEIPNDLSFSCDGRSYGYYADQQTNCQVFHICLGTGDIKWSFLCPNQTIFNQQYFVCDYAVNVNCLNADKFYELNDNFGKVLQAEDGTQGREFYDDGYDDRVNLEEEYYY